MKKSIAAVLAGSSVFALAAAAASQLTVNGVSDPKAGTDAAVTCNVGDVTVTPVHDGTKLNAFTLTTSADGSADAGCAGFTIYAKVAVSGTGAPASGFLFLKNLGASTDRTGGTNVPFGVAGDVFSAYSTAGGPATNVAAPNLTDITLGTVSVVVAATAPTGDTSGTPAGWGA